MPSLFVVLSALLGKIFAGEGIQIVSGSKFDFSRKTIQFNGDVNLPVVSYNEENQLISLNLAKLDPTQREELKNILLSAEKGLSCSGKI